MKIAITIQMETTLLRNVRQLAAEEGVSVSALLATRLDQIVHKRKAYGRARKRALARLREGLDLGWTPLAHATSFTSDDDGLRSRRLAMP